LAYAACGGGAGGETPSAPLFVTPTADGSPDERGGDPRDVARRRICRATKRGPSEPNPQCDEHLVEAPQLGLKRLDGPPMTPRTLQAASTLDSRERIDLRFQKLADLGLAGVQNPPKQPA
jgi:hypothetical protein